MSGSRQHFLPRFLKKGFASRTERKEVYTWVFTKDQAPYEANLKNVGLGKEFYGKPGEFTLDEKITKQEDGFAHRLTELRSLKKTCDLEGSFPVEFIIHLVLRAKHLRQSIQEAGETIVAVAQEKLDTPEAFAQMLSHLFETRPELIVESLERKLQKGLPSDFPEDKKQDVIRYALGLFPQILPKVVTEGQIMFNGLFEKMIELMPEIMKGAHIQELYKYVSPAKWIERFDGFDWALNVTQDPAYILGDIGPIFRHHPCLTFKPLIFSSGEIAQVYLPISDTQVIVGISKQKKEILNSDEINFASATLSQDYFISSKRGEEENALAGIISSEASNIRSDELSKLDEMLEKDLLGRC